MHSTRIFSGLDLACDAIPDETTILNFRHLLEKHSLTEALFDAVKTTTGKVHDAKLTGDLIREDDWVIFGDKGYVSDKRKRVAGARGATWAVKGKRKPGRVLSASQKKRNKKGIVRAKVSSRACQSIRCRAAEHVFRVIKCQFGYRKVRYHGLAKNEAQMFSLPLGHVNMPCRAVDGAGQPLPRATMLEGGVCLKSGK